jgi:hypothetical protein
VSRDRRNRAAYEPVKNRKGLVKSLDGHLTYERIPIEERLYSKVLRQEEGCWIWQGTHASKGYAQFRVDGILTSPHRIMYILAYGTIPDGTEIDHLCHVRNCVNPDHLRAVDHSTNQRNRRNI